MDDMQADPSAMDPSSTDTDAPDTGTELCIKIAEDGSLSVYKEVGEDDSGEQNAQPAADIGAALKMILDMYKGLSQSGGDQAFDDGFGSQQEQPGAGSANSARRQGMMR